MNAKVLPLDIKTRNRYRYARRMARQREKKLRAASTPAPPAVIPPNPRLMFDIARLRAKRKADVREAIVDAPENPPGA